MPLQKAVVFQEFLSTPSARRATDALGNGVNNPLHFYPRPPRGGRPCRDQYDELQRLFLSTPSARRATVGWMKLPIRSQISIHALREEGDRSSSFSSAVG